MSAPANRTAAIVVAAAAVLLVGVLATVGAPSQRQAPAPATPPAAPPPAVSGGGVTLASMRIELPADDARYPAGPQVDMVDANCTACHSPAMVLTQPKLTPDQWKAEVTKMREVYKAPVPDAAVPAILAYLTSLPTQAAARAPAKPGTPG